MRVRLAAGGDLAARLREEEKRIRRAVDDGVRQAGQGARADLSAHLSAADLGGLSRAVGMAFYRSRAQKINAAAIIYMRGRSARRAVAAMEYGAVVRAKNARFLAIPTENNRAGGRRGGRVLFTPSQLTDSFVRREEDGTLILYARVQHAQIRQKSGRIRDRAYVENRLMVRGRSRQTADLLAAGAVPMFILRAQVTIKKRLDIAAIREKWRKQTPGLVAGLLRRREA
jgi:hypothetical protein